MADEQKMQPAGEPEKTQAASSAQQMAVDPGARISELVAEFDKAKMPFAKLEPLLPQVKTTSGETMVGLSVLNPAKKEDRHKFLTRPQFETSRKIMAERL